MKEQLGGRRLLLTDDQHRQLAAQGKRPIRALLARVATIVRNTARANPSGTLL